MRKYKILFMNKEIKFNDFKKEPYELLHQLQGRRYLNLVGGYWERGQVF